MPDNPAAWLMATAKHRAIDHLRQRALHAGKQAEYGVAVRWAEDRSRNTHENARFSAALLKADGVATVVLVAHSMDMPRARAEFAAAGIATVAAPTGLTSAGGPTRGQLDALAGYLEKALK